MDVWSGVGSISGSANLIGVVAEDEGTSGVGSISGSANLDTVDVDTPGASGVGSISGSANLRHRQGTRTRLVGCGFHFGFS